MYYWILSTRHGVPSANASSPVLCNRFPKLHVEPCTRSYHPQTPFSSFSQSFLRSELPCWPREGRRVRRIPNALLLLFWSQWSMISFIFSVTKKIRRQSVSWPLKRPQNQPDQVCFVAVLLIRNCRHQPDIYILCLKPFLRLNYIFLSWFQSFAWFRIVFGYGTVS